MELQKLYEKNWDKIRFALKIDGLKDEVSEKLSDQQIRINERALMISNAKVHKKVTTKQQADNLKRKIREMKKLYEL